MSVCEYKNALLELCESHNGRRNWRYEDGCSCAGCTVLRQTESAERELAASREEMKGLREELDRRVADIGVLQSLIADFQKAVDPINYALISPERASHVVSTLKQQLKDAHDDNRSFEIERSRNADKFSREGY
jgi:hypothetical protein